MRTVIGVDPSLRRTGVAVWREGRVVTFSVPTTPDDGPRVVRERIIAGKIMPHIMHAGRVATTLVMIEAVHMSRVSTGRTALDLAGLHDVLVYGFHARGLTVGVAAPQAAKQLATGKGNAPKPAMVVAAAAELGITVANADEADALWFAALGVVFCGGTINGWPAHLMRGQLDKARANALTKVDWVGDTPDPDWLKEQ